MAETTLPPLPVYPGPDAGDAALAQYRAELDTYRAAASAAHAQAQADTAAQMAASVAAQQAMAAAMSKPPASAPYDPVATAVRVAAELAAHTPMTPDQIAKRARDVALQLGQEFG